MKNSIAALIRYAAFFGSIMLVAISSNSIRADWGDVIYAIIAIFILAGGQTIARILIAAGASITNWRARSKSD